ncbi:MAG: Xaa-Pro peptidase family protein [Anaerolineae bacterium]|nr:Xaa-Pro peptidase family protein [Anaerolineae bacterium]
MGKIIYTKDDIERMTAEGITLLSIDDQVVVTHEAREVAEKVGLQLSYPPSLPESPRRPGHPPDLQRRARQVAKSWSFEALPPKVNIQQLRHYRLNRVREQLRRLDCGACVLVDPVNIRYATDTRNMQVFSARNPARYLFLPVEGPVILFEFERCDHLPADIDTIDEVRVATTASYVAAADRLAEKTQQWAAEIADLMRQYGGGSKRIGLERFNYQAGVALAQHGFEILDAQHAVERARTIKSTDEIECIRWSLKVVADGVARMRDQMRPGLTENQIWSILHQAVIENDGDYIETRLLSSGPRTNPWMQEAGPRVVEPSDLVALDTDVVGPFGYYADFSRTFFCGSGRPSREQKKLYNLAYEQIHHNLALLKPGVTFREIAEKAWKIPEPYLPNRYFVLAHGVGMTGEYPYLLHLQDFDNGYDGVLQPGTTLCMESYIGEYSDADTDNGSEGVKLEQQVLITETGYELLSLFPFEENLLG